MDHPSPPSEAAPRAEADRPAPADFVPLRLVLHPGGAMLEVNRVDALVGRHSDADVRLPLPDVSRRHCRLLWLEGRWHVLDLHSLNGVFVNDEAVQQAALQAGDLLRIGGFTFRVDFAAPAVPDSDDGVLHGLLKSLPAPGTPTPRRRAS
jgi:pSer/pThr/pTyr-binding forkhead associated (FHA) protein